MLKVSASIVALLLISPLSVGTQPVRTALVGATLIDGNGGPPVRDAVVVMSGDRIVAAGPRATVAVPPGAHVIDGTGRWLVPGFVDTNVHLSLYGGAADRYESLVRYEPRQNDIVLEAAQIDLAHGITTVRDSYGMLRPLTHVRDLIAAGTAVGPRIQAAGNIVGWSGPYSVSFSLTKPGGLTLFQEQMNDEVAQGAGDELMTMTPDQLRSAIDAYLDKGPDFIKYGGTSHFEEPTYIGFSPEAQRVIVEEAHKRNRGAETHATSAEGLRIAIDAGIDLIQHPEIVDGMEIPDPLVATIRERKIVCSMLVSTITGEAWQKHLKDRDAAVKKRAEQVKEGALPERARTTFEQRQIDADTGKGLELRRRSAEKLVRAGAVVTVGTDSYWAAAPELTRMPKPHNQDHGTGTILAIEGLVELGMTPSQALVAATKNGAIASRDLEDYGTVESGKIADLVLLSADPLADIHNIEKVDQVIKSGRVIDVRALPEQRVLSKAPPARPSSDGSTGDVSFANSGAPAAQRAFLAGLAQLHNFEYDSAAAHFREAERVDPGFAMAYWGEAMTYNHPVWMQQDRAAAVRVLDRLGETEPVRLAKAPTEREKDYLRAVDILYGAGDKAARDVAYSDAMADLHGKYPDDPDAAAFYALSLLGTAHGGRDFATYMRAAAVLEPVFRAYPRHPGAAHYLIHSYDDPIHAPLGLPAARAYSTIAPSAAHAQHMCSHIFVAMGMWDDVVSANEAAVRVVDAARAAKGQPPGACGHYNFWLEYRVPAGRPRRRREEGAVRLLRRRARGGFWSGRARSGRLPGWIVCRHAGPVSDRHGGLDRRRRGLDDRCLESDRRARHGRVRDRPGRRARRACSRRGRIARAAEARPRGAGRAAHVAGPGGLRRAGPNPRSAARGGDRGGARPDGARPAGARDGGGRRGAPAVRVRTALHRQADRGTARRNPARVGPADRGARGVRARARAHAAADRVAARAASRRAGNRRRAKGRQRPGGTPRGLARRRPPAGGSRAVSGAVAPGGPIGGQRTR